MHGLSRQDRLQRSARAAAQATVDDLVVLDLDSGRYFALGEVGAFLWQRLDGERDLAALAADLAAAYEISPQRAEQDVMAFAGELVEQGLARSR